MKDAEANSLFLFLIYLVVFHVKPNYLGVFYHRLKVQAVPFPTLPCVQRPHVYGIREEVVQNIPAV